MITETKVRIAATYGDWFDHVIVNGRELTPGSSQELFNHSPDGFAWGYSGSGPAQLALAILFEVTHDKELSLCYHQEFKQNVIANMPQREDWMIELDLWDWLADHGAEMTSCAACGKKHFGRCEESIG
jgi:hypothetical protein